MVVETRRRVHAEQATMAAPAEDSDEEGGGGATEISKKEKEERERQRRRNQKRKTQKKRSKGRKATEVKEEDADEEAAALATDEEAAAEEDDVEVEYVAQKPELTLADPNYFYYLKIFDTFKITDDEKKVVEGSNMEAVKKESGGAPEGRQTKAAILDRIMAQEEEDKKEKEASDREKAGDAHMSKRKQRLAMRPSIAQLKASCGRPDVVEWHDVTSKEPKLLVHLKSIRNTIPVPRHWCFKRKYLAGKRGFERPPFELPEFIRKTGICEMRQALTEKEEEKSLKTKMREKARPKIGKIDIDYQKLHDAFFRWQTKPYMSIMGDLYFEGKEHETRLREKKPGELSDDLRIALGMPVGPNASRFPPPWLIAMQRYGPPPSYPNLKIPGLNAPIPEACAFGYHAGGWGKPPVDDLGKPLYGDVFGLELPPVNPAEEAEMARKPWGEMDSSDSEEESEEEEEEEKEAEEDADDSGLVTPAEGLITPSGISSGMPTGVETPDSIELRKKKLIEDGGDTPSSLYQVLPEKRVDRIAGQMMASTHVYDLSAAAKAADGGVEVALNPEELDAGLSDPKGLEAKYEAVLRQQRGQRGDADADFSDMVADHAAKQNRKRKAQEDKKGGSQSSSSSNKKYKDFKF